jgi:hypothetical protein
LFRTEYLASFVLEGGKRSPGPKMRMTECVLGKPSGEHIENSPKSGCLLSICSPEF